MSLNESHCLGGLRGENVDAGEVYEIIFLEGRVAESSTYKGETSQNLENFHSYRDAI